MRTKLTADFLWLLTSTLEEKGLKEKPCQIYTCAKTKFKLYFDKKKVPQKIKHSDIQTKRTKNVTTILACFNAAGEDIPPLIIYKGKYPRGHYKKEGLHNALYGTSAAGDLDGEMFKKWFIEHFLEFAVRDRPLLLIMDGQVNPELVQDAQREEVTLLCLPPHTSHILQPLDVSFFGPLKSDFSEVTGDPSAETHSFSVSKKEFSRVLRDCYQRLKDQQLVVDGFKRCGLYPLDPTAIDPSQVMSSALQPENLAPAPSTQLSSCLHPTHPLVASGQIPADLIQVLTKTYQTCNTSKVRRNARVLISQKKSDVIMKGEDCVSEIETQTQLRKNGVHQNRIETSGATSSTLPDSSCPSSNRGQPLWDPIATASASHSPSAEEASSLYQNSFIPTAPLSSGSSSTTAGPTTSTDHIAAKRTKMMRILRCGRCRQSYPPCDPEGLVLWVQCNNCHKLFHTICVSSEMDLDEEEFWCFWCLDV
ncbi:uncharacterized protein LOC113140229 [Mastacembelus armatus]|uniref:uncharacterized protein LOC113140229 n=1 Tax=Mastacembelus armatus TaxID=205130 RepID=UPI000E45A765|nr:uncharacterized protein LOC113140229 [Mastacembelus armatus]